MMSTRLPMGGWPPRRAVEWLHRGGGAPRQCQFEKDATNVVLENRTSRRCPKSQAVRR
jgi:hypothetical protein